MKTFIFQNTKTEEEEVIKAFDKNEAWAKLKTKVGNIENWIEFAAQG